MNPLLPPPLSFPEELILDILARLPNKSRHRASLVCHKWLHLIESRQFYILRKKLGHLNHLACFFHSSHPPSNPQFHHNVIVVFDPITRDCKTLPPTSVVFNFQSEIVNTEGKLIVMNQADSKNRFLGNSIFIFDFSSSLWRRGKDFPTRRSCFAMGAAPNGLVFVAGGFNPDNSSPCYAWTYDVRKDEWSELTPTNHLAGVSRGQVYRNRFIVSTSIPCSINCSVEMYNLHSGEWTNVQGTQIRSSPYEVYTQLDGTKCSWRDYVYKVYRLPLGYRTLMLRFRKTNLVKLDLFGIVEEGNKFVQLPIPHLISGNLYPKCVVEVH